MAPGEIKAEEEIKKEQDVATKKADSSKPTPTQSSRFEKVQPTTTHSKTSQTQTSSFEKVKPSSSLTSSQAPFKTQAKTFEQVKPTVPGQISSAAVTSGFKKVQPTVGNLPPQVAASRAIPANMDQVQLLDSLQGLVFVSDPKAIKPEGLSGVSGVKVDGLKDLQTADFKKITSKYIGKPITMAKLNELNREVVAYYNANDFPVVDVAVPEQDITKGVIQLVVLKGQLGKVKVEGNKWFGSNLLAGQIRTAKNGYILGKKMLSDLDWLNRNPFRRADLVYSRGAEAGQTDVVLKIEDRFPVRFYAGYENTGNKRTGDNRWFTGFNWGNAFLLDHQLNYQYTTNNETSLFSAHSGSYSAPLPWRHIVSAFGSYGEAKTDDALFNVNGRSYQISGRYTIPLPKLQNDVLTYNQEMSFGYDHKNTNNNLEFGGATALTSVSEVDQFLATYQASLRDDWGSTSFGANFYYSPGNIGSENTDRAFAAQRAGAEADYAYLKANLERVNKLPWDMSLFARVTAQISEANLLGSEQLGAGGFSTVRGYEEREANGDSGYITNLELRSPSFKPLQWAGLTSINDDLQFLVFWDYASVGNKFLVAGESAHTQLSSVGPGFRYVINPYLTMRFDYGFQLMDSEVSGSNDRFNSRANLGLILSY